MSQVYTNAVSSASVEDIQRLYPNLQSENSEGIHYLQGDQVTQIVDAQVSFIMLVFVFML